MALADGPVTAAVLLRDVRFAWRRGRFTLTVPHLAVASGERVLLVGPSGVGKSTLLGLIGGVLPASDGAVQVLGQDLAALSARARDRFRGEHAGIVFQQFNLLPYASVLDNVLLPLRFAPQRRARAGGWQQAAAEARRLLSALELDPSLERAGAATLSVGQQQRVAAARALIGSPEILLADEPTSALDQDSQRGFLELVFAEAARAGTTVLVVSHAPALAQHFDRVLDLRQVRGVPAEAA